MAKLEVIDTQCNVTVFGLDGFPLSALRRCAICIARSLSPVFSSDTYTCEIDTRADKMCVEAKHDCLIREVRLFKSQFALYSSLGRRSRGRTDIPRRRGWKPPVAPPPAVSRLREFAAAARKQSAPSTKTSVRPSVRPSLSAFPPDGNKRRRNSEGDGRTTTRRHKILRAPTSRTSHIRRRWKGNAEIPFHSHA